MGAKGIVALNLIKTGNPVDFSWLSGGFSGAAVAVFFIIVGLLVVNAIIQSGRKK